MDYLIVAYIPSFYKINLYNKIAKRKKIFVVFLAKNEKKRDDNFIHGDIEFEHIFLYNGFVEDRNRLISLIKLYKIIFSHKYKNLLLNGWDLLEYWSCLIFDKQKNSLAVESSYYESTTNGIKGVIKKIFLSRVSQVFASGQNQKKLVDILGFKGNVVLTGGVGLINTNDFKHQSNKTFSNKFLYVGRLSEEKNISLLVEVFLNNPDKYLTIVGSGPLQNSVLEAIQNKNNIQYTGQIPNQELYSVYLDHDVFILPSLCEPWGLVVEEAVYFGLPVIVSSKVGCNDFVKKYRLGIVFDSSKSSSLNDSLKQFDSTTFEHYRKNILNMSFEKVFEKQVDSYIL